MRAILTLILSFLMLNSFSQTIEEREIELRAVVSGERTGNPIIKISELLAVDKYNSTAIEFKLVFYSRLNQKDSIKIFFDNLINSNLNSPIPYLLRAKFSKFESLNKDQKLKYLEKAHMLDSTNINVNYSLAKFYYELFNEDQKSSWRKTEQSNAYAKTAIKFINKTCSIDKHFIETLKYPFVQLCNYLGDTINVNIYNNYIDKTSYFPMSSLITMPFEWEADYMTNIMDWLENSRLKWYTRHLQALKEPTLYNLLPQKVFRFLWLRTFDNPIAIRIENENNKITLYWKMCDGKGGYEPGEITVNERKQIPIAEWIKIEEKINSIDFWNRPPTINDFFGTDGSQWILEGKKSDKYHFLDRWNGMEVSEICMDLLKLTDLKIEEIY